MSESLEERHIFIAHRSASACRKNATQHFSRGANCFVSIGQAAKQRCFGPPKLLFSLLFENAGDRHAFQSFDLSVGVKKPRSRSFGQSSAHGRFTGSHKSNQYNIRHKFSQIGSAQY
jgi:hypothetical protein